MHREYSVGILVGADSVRMTETQRGVRGVPPERSKEHTCGLLVAHPALKSFHSLRVYLLLSPTESSFYALCLNS